MIWNQSFWNQSSWAPVAQTSNPRKTMAQQNIAEIRATQVWIDTLTTLLQAVIDHLNAKAVPLTVEEKTKYKTFGDESATMVANGVMLIRDNAGWFPGTYDRAELLLDVADRELWLQPKSLVMTIDELYHDTLHAVSSDILKAVGNARPFIEQGAELTGTSNDQVNEFLDYFKRFGPQDNPPTPTPPPTPPTP
jgi:hypothetical protein